MYIYTCKCVMALSIECWPYILSEEEELEYTTKELSTVTLSHIPGHPVKMTSHPVMITPSHSEKVQEKRTSSHSEKTVSHSEMTEQGRRHSV